MLVIKRMFELDAEIIVFCFPSFRYRFSLFSRWKSFQESWRKTAQAARERKKIMVVMMMMMMIGMIVARAVNQGDDSIAKHCGSEDP